MAESSNRTTEQLPRASRKRRLLAWYLDFLLFGAPWLLLVRSLGEAFADLQPCSFPIKLVVFIALETLVLRLLGGSPGHWLLGIYQRAVADPFAASGRRSSLVVDPWLESSERWWTMLFGVLAILNGLKSLVRWTMWTPPIPFLGLQLDETASALVLTTLGIFECAIGWAALRLRPVFLPLGLAFYGLTVGSTVLSWRLWPAWIEEYVVARRAYQGLSVREGEMELGQMLMPGAMVVWGVFLGLWMLLVARRIQRARA